MHSPHRRMRPAFRPCLHASREETSNLSRVAAPPLFSRRSQSQRLSHLLHFEKGRVFGVRLDALGAKLLAVAARCKGVARRLCACIYTISVRGSDAALVVSVINTGMTQRLTRLPITIRRPANEDRTGGQPKTSMCSQENTPNSFSALAASRRTAFLSSRARFSTSKSPFSASSLGERAERCVQGCARRRVERATASKPRRRCWPETWGGAAEKRRKASRILTWRPPRAASRRHRLRREQSSA